MKKGELSLRSKVIVINDEQFKLKKSFVNLGPIEAISENNPENIIYYKMKPNGVEVRDSIADVFIPLKNRIQQHIVRQKNLRLDQLDLSDKINRHSMQLLHDIIYVFGPINNKELMAILTQIFGKKDFKEANVGIGLLMALKLIVERKDGRYSVTSPRTLLKYNESIFKILVTSRKKAMIDGRAI